MKIDGTCSLEEVKEYAIHHVDILFTASTLAPLE
jgi:hypothetical protein